MAVTQLKPQGLDEIITSSNLSRQAAINSNLSIWQRGTSFTYSGSAVYQYTADHVSQYHDAQGGTLPTLTVTRQNLTPGDIPNSFYYLRLANSGTGSSLGVNAQGFLEIPIEYGTRFLAGAGKQLTVSFYARSSISGKKLTVSPQQYYGTGGSPTAGEDIAGSSVTLTSTWTKYTWTFNLNTLVGKTFGTNNDDAIFVDIFTMWGSTLATTIGASGAETYGTSGTVDIAQIQINSGNVALPFQPKSFQDELQACKRYYEKTYDLSTTAGSVTTGALWATAIANNAIQGFRFTVEKRVAPTVTIYAENGNSAKVTSLAGATSGTTVTAVAITTGGFRQVNDSGTGFTAGGYYTYHYVAESEL